MVTVGVWVMVRVEEMIRVPDSVETGNNIISVCFLLSPPSPPLSSYRNHGTSEAVSTFSLSFAASTLIRSPMLVRRPFLLL